MVFKFFLVFVFTTKGGSMSLNVLVVTAMWLFTILFVIEKESSTYFIQWSNGDTKGPCKFMKIVDPFQCKSLHGRPVAIG